MPDHTNDPELEQDESDARVPATEPSASLFETADTLERISWEQWFRAFDDGHGPAMPDRASEGSRSNGGGAISRPKIDGRPLPR